MNDLLFLFFHLKNKKEYLGSTISSFTTLSEKDIVDNVQFLILLLLEK